MRAFSIMPPWGRFARTIPECFAGQHFMTASSDGATPAVTFFCDDASRWQAVMARDPAADGAFVYSVRTTGVYCRPTCPARRARRAHVQFHATCRDAEAAGFRACKRCKPTEAGLAARHVEAVIRACRVIEQSDEVPGLADLARLVGMSPAHFHRVFKAQTGLTPKRYAAAQRARRFRGELERGGTVTAAIHGAGYGSSSRFYESSNDVLGMTPKSFRAGGCGATIRFAIGACRLGAVLVAATDKGVCAILFGDDPDELARDLQGRFPHAELIGGDSGFEQVVARVIGFVEAPSTGLDLPLDIRGTAFQQCVWEALRRIPAGSTATYAEIAARIGRPRSVRAVARACGANALAVAIPCHRVVRSDGGLSGYRWGAERKERLLRRERGEG